MVKISLLDKDPFYYHEYERALRPLQTMRFDKHGKARPEYERDQDGFVLYEQPGKDWCLSYEPAYIITDEQWLIDRILDYAKDALTKSIYTSRKEICSPAAYRKRDWIFAFRRQIAYTETCRRTTRSNSTDLQQSFSQTDMPTERTGIRTHEKNIYSFGGSASFGAACLIRRINNCVHYVPAERLHQCPAASYDKV